MEFAAVNGLRGATSTTASLTSTLRGQKLNVNLNLVRRTGNVGPLEVFMTATLPPKTK